MHIKTEYNIFVRVNVRINYLDSWSEGFKKRVATWPAGGVPLAAVHGEVAGGAEVDDLLVRARLLLAWSVDKTQYWISHLGRLEAAAGRRETRQLINWLVYTWSLLTATRHSITLSRLPTPLLLQAGGTLYWCDIKQTLGAAAFSHRTHFSRYLQMLVSCLSVISLSWGRRTPPLHSVWSADCGIMGMQIFLFAP